MPHPGLVRAAVGVVVLTLALGMVGPAAAAPGAPSGAASGAGATAACRSGHVALTFDDGPAPDLTPRLLSTLRRLHVPATFFMVGERVAAAPASARQVESSGFLVANHSYHHEDLRRLSREQIIATLQSTDRALRAAGVHPTRLMRPPYGAVDAHVYAAIRATHLRPVLWDVDPRDWESGTADQIAARILGQLRPGERIVLQHDGVGNSSSSVAAVPRIVAEARRRGFCFVALDERGRPGFPTPGATLAAARTVTEGQRLALSVTLDAMAGRDTAVRVAVGGGGKDLGDFDPVLRVPAGSLTATLRIPVRRDRLDEKAERLRVKLVSGDGVRVRGSALTVTIRDADGPPSVAGRPAGVVEPSTGSVAVPVTFTLDHPSTRPVALSVQTVPGTADASDFTALATTVTIPPGATSVVVPVSVLADALPEGPETFALRITGASGARIAAADAVVTINPL